MSSSSSSSRSCVVVVGVGFNWQKQIFIISLSFIKRLKRENYWRWLYKFVVDGTHARTYLLYLLCVCALSNGTCLRAFPFFSALYRSTIGVVVVVVVVAYSRP